MIKTCNSPLIVSLPAVVAAFRMRILPIGLDGIDVTVDAPDGAPIAPPNLSVLVDGEDEPFVLEAKRSDSGAVHRAFIQITEADEARDIFVTAFDGEGNPTVLRQDLLAACGWCELCAHTDGGDVCFYRIANRAIQTIH